MNRERGLDERDYKLRSAICQLPSYGLVANDSNNPMLARKDVLALLRQAARDRLDAAKSQKGGDTPRAAWDESPTFTIEGLTLFGKLTELRDKDEEEDSKRGFWGELKRENGESWRVQFKLGDLDAVTQLFRKQVSVTGKAFYFRSQSPKLIAQTISGAGLRGSVR